jgi:UDP-3-O-[3-hydroxymyristoyl] N-acetylglucosamine deacetylase
VRDVEALWAAGFALGSSLENSVVIDDDVVLNPEGLRFGDEFVRHKVLDALGDLALAGMPIQGVYRSFRGGHKLNAIALTTLLSRPDAWRIVAEAAGRGQARSERGAELGGGLVASALSPEVR